MRVTNNLYRGVSPAFGTNKGFLEAAEKLKKSMTTEDINLLDAHSQNVVKDSTFIENVNNILEDEKTPKLLKKLIRECLKLD